MKKKIAHKSIIAVLSIVLYLSVIDISIADNNISYDDNIIAVKELNIDIIEHNLHGDMFRDILTMFNMFNDIPLDIYKTAAFIRYNNYKKSYEIYYNIDIQILMNDLQILCIKNHEYGHIRAHLIGQYFENSDYTNRTDCNELFKKPTIK